jgi:hypothetical protein
MELSRSVLNNCKQEFDIFHLHCVKGDYEEKRCITFAAMYYVSIFNFQKTTT